MSEIKTSFPRRTPAPRRPVVTTTMPPSVTFSAPAMTDFGASAPMKPQRSFRMMHGVVIAAILVVLAAGAGYAVSNPKFFSAFSKKTEFAAVFLTNGQAFFGNIVSENEQNLVLDNVFYLQLVNDNVPAATEGEQPQTVQRQQLVMKGEEPYGPENRIRINRSQVAVIEKLSEKSTLLQEIKQRLQQK